MNLKLLACLACGAALLVGACSSNNNTTAGTESGSSGTDGNAGADGNGNAGADGNENGNAGNGDSEAPTSIAGLRMTALDAVSRAQAAATAAQTGTEADGVRAQNLIKTARDALDAVVAEAERIRAAATGGSLAVVGTAERAVIDANNLRNRQNEILDTALTSFAWFGKEVVRATIPNGDVDVPSDGANEVTFGTMGRIPRTIRTSATDSTQIPNPAAIKSTTFTPVMYEDGKVLLSGGGRRASPTVTSDEFKVDGYIFGMTQTSPLDTATRTGLTLTNTGLAIRIGGTRAAADGVTMTDYTDMRKDVTKTVDTDRGDDDSIGTLGENGWDLAIAFDQPKTTSFANKLTSWQGNGDFYWKGIVNADESQLSSTGANYQSGAFTQPRTPRDYRDLGTYEVWLSNNIGIDKNLEPAEGQTGTCPDGSRRTSCPDDDENRYLSYAAYGLFTYKAATDVTSTAEKSRVQSMNFGYQAFAEEDGKRTRDISKAISSGTFTGQTLATAIEGTETAPKTTLLRGNVSLTVSIPKDSATPGTVSGTLNGFEEWVPDTNWKDYKFGNNDFSVALGSATIMPDGSYTGVATANPISAVGSSGVGVFKGNFYGPRTDAADLETAGSWDVGAGADRTGTAPRIIVGSFGAKQKAAATPSN